MLDRAKAHLTSLNRAEVRGKILSINIKPIVLDKEDPEFKAEWAKAIAEVEKSLLRTLQTHLAKVCNNVTANANALLSSYISWLTVLSSK